MKPSHVTAKQFAASHKLDRAIDYLVRTRKFGSVTRSLAILDAARRFVRCGFNTPITYEYFNFDAPCNGTSLYPPDRIIMRGKSDET